MYGNLSSKAFSEKNIFQAYLNEFSMKLFDAFSTKDQVDGHFFQTFSQNMEKMAIFYIFTCISILKWGSFDFISLVKLTLLQTSRVPGYMSMQ